MGMLLRNGRLFLKKKNEASLLRDMVNQVKIVKQACRKEQAQHLQWSGRGLKVLFHATKIVLLTNSPKFSNWAGKRLILPFVCDMIFKSPRIISEPKFSNRARFDSSRKRTKKQPSNINLFNGCFFVAGPGIEPGTSWLWIMRSNQLSYPAIISDLRVQR